MYQIGCNAVAIACYFAAESKFGTVVTAAALPAIVACNSALGTCPTGCAALLILPIP
ncbi:uncharacterized protein EI90DRAFT_3079715 [Cantharellus anzutake]|uniref:uncharacterized protein n=1 Tax=Cantharellus anzutake TaxID=1750568 RepID=UPI001908ECE2|nr:uncharacterized protein EI90DRAFT_3079715 [Cantharellus anzutake]KAF8320960.1 hypothetical protein EI90DRAFT_3079715 [Cantharellus anzutake]